MKPLSQGYQKILFTGVFSLDELTSYCNTYASSMMNNQPYTLDTSAMEQKLSGISRLM